MMKMFQKIQELIDDREALVCVLIDEVYIYKCLHIVYTFYAFISLELVQSLNIMMNMGYKSISVN